MRKSKKYPFPKSFGICLQVDKLEASDWAPCARLIFGLPAGGLCHVRQCHCGVLAQKCHTIARWQNSTADGQHAISNTALPKWGLKNGYIGYILEYMYICIICFTRMLMSHLNISWEPTKGIPRKGWRSRLADLPRSAYHHCWPLLKQKTRKSTFKAPCLYSAIHPSCLNCHDFTTFKLAWLRLAPDIWWLTSWNSRSNSCFLSRLKNLKVSDRT